MKAKRTQPPCPKDNQEQRCPRRSATMPTRVMARKEVTIPQIGRVSEGREIEGAAQVRQQRRERGPHEPYSGSQCSWAASAAPTLGRTRRVPQHPPKWRKAGDQSEVQYHCIKL